MTKPLCPICGKPFDPRFRPFCSKRCADVDLQRWFAGVSTVPGEDHAEADPAPPTDDED